MNQLKQLTLHTGKLEEFDYESLFFIFSLELLHV